MRELNCVVTGASSGIGKYISIELSKTAKHIYILARNVKELEKVHDIIIKNDCNCTIVPLDLTDINVIENLAIQIMQKDTYVNILILSAGIINQLSPVDSINLVNFENILKLNYLSNFRMIKNFHPLLKNSNEAKIGVISSKNNSKKNQYWGIYQPTMSALNELILTYANENNNLNIKTNIFCPTAVNTKFREIFMPGEDKNTLIKPDYVAYKIVNYILKTKESGKIIEIN